MAMPRDLGTGRREVQPKCKDLAHAFGVCGTRFFSPPLVLAKGNGETTGDEWQMTGSELPGISTEVCPFSGLPRLTIPCWEMAVLPGSAVVLSLASSSKLQSPLLVLFPPCQLPPGRLSSPGPRHPWRINPQLDNFLRLVEGSVLCLLSALTCPVRAERERLNPPQKAPPSPPGSLYHPLLCLACQALSFFFTPCPALLFFFLQAFISLAVISFFSKGPRSHLHISAIPTITFFLSLALNRLCWGQN